MPLKFTAVVPEPFKNPDPFIVTTVPAGPNMGEKSVIDVPGQGDCEQAVLKDKKQAKMINKLESSFFLRILFILSGYTANAAQVSVK